MAFFKVKCQKSEPGVYTLAYGKGGKKLGAILEHLGNGDWVVTHEGGKEFDRSDKKREIVDAWEKWAASAYGTTQKVRPTTGVASAILPSADVAFDDSEDELNDLERALFQVLSGKHGRLTEWQRSQCRVILKRLTGFPAVPAKRPGPPKLGGKTNGVSSDPEAAIKAALAQAAWTEPSEAPAADTDQAGNVESSEVSCTEQSYDTV